MKIAIAGGTGFVGKALSELLLRDGHELFILTRNIKNKRDRRGVTHIEWFGENSRPEKKLNGVDALINLSGESINNRWTSKTKQEILNSRVKASQEMARIIQRLDQKPHVYMQASAVGFYGTSLTDTFTENDEKCGDDFLARVVSKWEQEGRQIAEMGIRTVFMRFGVILDRLEGALPRIVLPYKLFAGGTIGKGEQWLSWIHIDDVCRMIRFAIEHEIIEGVMSVTAPNPVKMKEFGKTIANVLNRPHWLPVPSFALKILLGEMSLLVLEGQRVLPKKAQQHGFQFRYEHLYDALEHILKNT